MNTLISMRAELCEDFLKYYKVNNCSIIDSNDEGHFSYIGCDVCNIKGCIVFDCNGYAPKTKEILELGEVCGDCIYYFYNGDDSEVKS
jgi:hypothetical protein